MPTTAQVQYRCSTRAAPVRYPCNRSILPVRHLRSTCGVQARCPHSTSTAQVWYQHSAGAVPVLSVYGQSSRNAAPEQHLRNTTRVLVEYLWSTSAAPVYYQCRTRTIAFPCRPIRRIGRRGNAMVRGRIGPYHVAETTVKVSCPGASRSTETRAPSNEVGDGSRLN